MRTEEELVQHFAVSMEDVVAFKEGNVGLCRVDTTRISTLLLFQLTHAHKKRTFNSFSITDVIQGLEGVGLGSFAKKEEQFKHPPLKGFWKAHFSDARFLMQNITNHWGLQHPSSQKFIKLLDQVSEDEAQDPSAHGWQGRLAHELVVTGYQERAKAKKLTGEWLVFAKHGEKNYYLAATRHSSTTEGDEEIYATLRHYCEHEFPFVFHLRRMSA